MNIWKGNQKNLKTTGGSLLTVAGVAKKIGAIREGMQGENLGEFTKNNQAMELIMGFFNS